MTIIMLFLIIFTIVAVVYAYSKEISESHHAYEKGVPNTKINIYGLLDKILICCGYDFQIVKWRLTLLVTIGIMILLFVFLFSRIPSPREYIISFIIIFSLVYMSRDFITKIHTEQTYNYIKTCINLIKKK